MKNEKLYVFRLKHRAVSGNAPCGIGQRSVLFRATQRAVLGYTACCVGSSGVMSSMGTSV